MYNVKAVTLAVLLIFVSQGFSQFDHIMLLENCGWKPYYDVSTTPVNLTLPNKTLSANLVCKTSFILKVPSWAANVDKLKVKVYHFDLNGPDSCIPYSERLMLQFRDSGYPNIIWCGKTFAEDLVFPVKNGYTEVMIVYSVGRYGLGSGFILQFSRDSNGYWSPGGEQQVLTSPKLLYSPYYPFDYISTLESFTITLRAPVNSFVHIASLEMNVVSYDCDLNKPLLINAVAYCGNSSLDIFIHSGLVRLELQQNFLMAGSSFVLKYSSFALESLTCAKNESFRILVDEQEKLLKINISNSLLTRCLIQIYTLSDDKVIQLKLPTWKNFQIYENNSAVNISNVQYFRSQGKVVTIVINPLMSPGLDRSTLAWNATAQAVDKVWLPTIYPSNNSLIWITEKLLKRQLLFQFYSDKAMGFKIFIPGLQSEPVAKHLILFNGPDSSYFDLTKDCNGMSLTDTEIFSLNSSVVSIGLKSGDLTEFQMFIYLKDRSIVKVPITPILQDATSGNYTFKKSDVIAKNLYCRWEIQTRNDLPLIKVRAGNNFKASSSSSMLVYQGSQDNLIARFDQFSPRGDIWLLSLTTLWINVAIPFPDSDSPEFGFSYVYSNTTGFRNICGNQYLDASLVQQWASTPNFPNFYTRNDSCLWTIRKSSVQFGTRISIDFPDLSSVLCQDEASLTISAAGSRGTIRLCDLRKFSQSYKDDSVTVQFLSSTLVKPGIQFAFRQEGPESKTCQANFTMTEDRVYSLEYSGSSELIGDCIYYLYPISYDSVFTLTVNVNFIYSNAMTVYVQQPQAGAASVWTPALLLDNLNNKRGNYTFDKSSPLKIRVSWENTSFKFLVYAFISRKSCSYVKLTATATPGYLSSPYYPDHYEYDTMCQWHITADLNYIVLEFLNFSVDGSDYCTDTVLEIYSGSPSETNRIDSICYLRDTLVTLSYELTLKYRTNSSGKPRGFRLKYYTIIEMTTPSTTVALADELNSSPAMIIGSVVACAIVGAILIAGILYSIRRRKLSRARQERDRAVVNYNRRTSAVYIFNPVIINNISPPPYPGLEIMGVPPPYSESSRSDEYSNLDLPPPYSAEEESNVHSAGVTPSVSSNEHVSPTELTLPENIYCEIDGSASGASTATISESCVNAAPSACPRERGHSQMAAASNPRNASRLHSRGNHTLGEL